MKLLYPEFAFSCFLFMLCCVEELTMLMVFREALYVQDGVPRGTVCWFDFQPRAESVPAMGMFAGVCLMC